MGSEMCIRDRSLTEGLTSSGGRNNKGRMTARRRGGGHKRLYRKIDFKRNKIDVFATVERLEYDPNRSAFIALIKYDDGELSYIIAPQRLNVGDKVISSDKADIKPGNTMPMKKMPIGTIIHNIEMKPGKGAQMTRSAGTFAQLVGRDQGMAILKLTSGEQRLVPDVCKATIGAVSNPDNSNTKLAKAGRNRWKGKRPSVRGVAMNPIDRRLIAIIPATTPGPMIETSSRDQISELMERDETMISNAIGRRMRVSGVVLRAARKASGTAITMVSMVPSVAILMVSQRGSHNSVI